MTIARTALILAAAIAASGCSVMRRHEARDTGDLLIAAGFRPKLTDTPARAEQLSAMPPLKMVSESKEGHVVYRYADPYSCDCLYVGDDDQIVPIGASALLSARVIGHSQLKVYEGAPHGLPSTHKDRVNADLLAFIGA